MHPKTIHEEMKSVPNEKMKHIAQSLTELNQLGECRTDEDVRDRVDLYFDFCGRTGIRPAIEGLALALNVDRTTVYRWRKGQNCSPERERIIKQATQYIYAFLEALGLSGQLNPAAFVWCSKNWMSYRDDKGFSERIPDTGDGNKFDINKAVEGLGLDDDLGV